jgi:ERCC4-related helicase
VKGCLASPNNIIIPSLINNQKVEPREYQLDLYEKALVSNTLIVLPTGLGKTVIAALVAARKLEENLSSKVLVLAPTKPLVNQLFKVFQESILLDKADFSELTGNESPEKRIKKWAGSKLLVCTPQVVRNDLIASRYDLSSVSVLIFDEAHRAVGDYAYVFIAKKYLSSNSQGLVLGLTASPGSSESSLKEICYNLGIKSVTIKQRSDPDVMKYVQKSDEKYVFVDPPKEFVTVLRYLSILLDKYLKPLKDQKLIFYSNTRMVSLRSLIDIQKKIVKQVSQTGWDERSSENMMSVTNSIRILQAVNLIETQGVTSTLLYIKRLEELSRKKMTKSIKALITDPFWVAAKTHLENLLKNGVEHPKLLKLTEIVSDYLRRLGGKAIVFTNYRDSSNLINDVLNRIEGIRSVRFVGQTDRGSDKGLTQKMQLDTLARFRSGEFNVLVATQVAEEGLDVDECNLVVMYDNVPSLVRLIQRSGRTGRKSSGIIVYLITKGTRDEAFYWITRRRKEGIKNVINRFVPDSGIEKSAHSSEAAGNDFKENKVVVVRSDVVQIIADTRETASSVLAALNDLGVGVKFEQLGVADYIVSDQVCIERKSTSDFASSILDGRLFEQALNMRRTYRRPILIIEGENIYASSLNPESIRGALISLAVDYGIPILWSRSASETALMISRIATREQREMGRPKPIIRDVRKPVFDNELKEYIVASLPGVDSIRAKKLLKNFHSVSAVFNASVSELEALDGIGEKTARRIKQIVEEEYSPEQDTSVRP